MIIRDNIGGFIPKVYGGTTLEKARAWLIPFPFWSSNWLGTLQSEYKNAYRIFYEHGKKQIVTLNNQW